MTPLLRMTLCVALSISAAGCATRAAPVASGQEERIGRMASGLITQHQVRGEDTRFSIEERLRFYGVPGVSVAVIDGGRIAWARAWGEVEAGSGMLVDTATLFQAASISKPVAAAGVLRLVEDGVLELDEDVNRWLASWKVPENEHTGSEKVTLRRLLSHSAGTTVHGFPGYSAGASVPTLVQLLDGAPPANTAAVRVDRVPGSLWRYSGGGTSIAQLVVMEVTGQPFADYMRARVLTPAGMLHSTYEQPLPAQLRSRAAVGHRQGARAIEGGYHTYPEQAAAGLWTTPSDLARFAIEIQRAHDGETGRVVTPATARLMLTNESGEYGLGFGLEGEADSLWFSHGGANAGFRAHFAALAERGQGAVVMTNGDGGSELAAEILRAIAREYDLPGFHSVERDAVALDEAAMDELAGDYFLEDEEAGREPFLRIRRDGAVLQGSVPRAGWVERTLRASPDDTLFFMENRVEFEIERDESGRVVGANVTGVGSPIRLVRR